MKNFFALMLAAILLSGTAVSVLALDRPARQEAREYLKDRYHDRKEFRQSHRRDCRNYRDEMGANRDGWRHADTHEKRRIIRREGREGTRNFLKEKRQERREFRREFRDDRR
jgi:hypothetical protein